MTTTASCVQNTDLLKLIREGTSQEQRFPLALDPSYAPINGRKPEHWMVFAQAYSEYLNYFNSQNTVDGDWSFYFSKDVSTLLAVLAIQDVDDYKNKIKEIFSFLNNYENKDADSALKIHLGYLFSYVGTLARRLDTLKEALPDDISLKEAVAFKEMLQNLIINQLAPLYRRLLSYYKADLKRQDSERLVTDSRPDGVMLGDRLVAFSVINRTIFSKDWIADESNTWNAYLAAINAADSANFGSGSVFNQINHIATHNLFTSIFDQFLKVYSRVVDEARHVLEATFKWDGHQPHYTLFLAFLKLLESVNKETNTLTKRHLDLYYREILRLKEKPAEPSRAHLLVELAKHVDSHELKMGELFKAGKDDLGIAAFFANERDFVPNQAKVDGLKTVYRYQHVPEESDDSLDSHDGRIFASQIANSDDGLGAELTSEDKSWHPFFNKIYKNGKLEQINMPEAEVGFAIASHYLWLVEGTRIITVNFTVEGAGTIAGLTTDRKNEIVCLFTTEEGWIEKTASEFNKADENKLSLKIELTAADPAITPYLSKTHGYNFSTNLPILLVRLQHQENPNYLYQLVQDIAIDTIELIVDVVGLKTLAISNDFGPVDASKPFQPYGASPVTNSSLTIGSKEVFQKALTDASINLSWFTLPVPYRTDPSVDSTDPSVKISILKPGQWEVSNGRLPINSPRYPFTNEPDSFVFDQVDFTPNEFYNTDSRHGFVRLSITNDFGQTTYQNELRDYLIDKAKLFPPQNPASEPSSIPIIPVISELTIKYKAEQTIKLDSKDSGEFANLQAKFFHIVPFGQAEQHPKLSSTKKVFLFPQFTFQCEGTKKQSEAEFYIGVTGLKPPQNIALLFQVADGTADPLSDKPDPHIHWSYLSANEWKSFAENAVEDQTNGLINSSIVTFSMPRDASADNTLLPSGKHWIRAAVESESDTVCKLLQVAAQALQVTFVDKGNDSAFTAKTLTAGTISKLDQPDANIKKIDQPFASFGGRGKERSEEFYTRISERLRHKDRGIALWDYERLVLEAFPQIYKVKCLNHTHYGTDDNGNAIFKELAPGHITIVTLPNQKFINQRDPLKPYTSLGLLKEIEIFLAKRLSCFVKLHVRNPQFEEVSVECKVGLHGNSDKTYYENKMQEAITRFLSPWAFSETANPSFGGRIYKSVLINFVEDLLYVDFVTDFKLFHSVVVDGKLEKSEKNVVVGSRPTSILVSAPKHDIRAIDPTEDEMPRELCRDEL